jgi:hypothetical protein
MVGRGVLYECLEDDRIEKVLVVNRSSLEVSHPKLSEILLKDFTKVESIKNHLRDYDACFYCMGVSSVGMDEAKFTKVTFDTTKAFADTLYDINPNMTFNYVSGEGTDSSENNSTMWKNVKGKTENYILKKGFKDAYMFRPNAIVPEKGIQSKTKLYNLLYLILRPFYGLMKKSKKITTTTRLGHVMIESLYNSQEQKHIENPEINILASEWRTT